MRNHSIGIDIGGTGIKAALVDTRSGVLLSRRIRVETPEGAEPGDISLAVAKLIDNFKDLKDQSAVGICFPAVVQHGFTRSAANVSADWIGLDAESLFADALKRRVHILNDADAAGFAEIKFGAGRGSKGLTIMTTLGTGIGTALFYDSRLIPNSELGHIEIGGVDYETMASFAAMEKDGLSFQEWAKRLNRYYQELEKLLSPDLFIVGGGISKKHELFLPLLDLKTKIIPAETRNSAGIIGAASLAAEIFRG
jgi:polyphosphate glucokinase